MVLVALVCGLPAAGVAQELTTQPPRAAQVCRMLFDSFDPALNTALAQHTERLLLTYAAGSSHSAPAARDIEAALTLDRRAVFHAAVRAMFVPVKEKASSATDASLDRVRAGGIDLNSAIKLVEFVDAVTGIWGARPGDAEGRHQFRLSVRWKPGLPKALSNSPCFSFGPPGHVIRPPALGEDADLNATPTVNKSGATSYRSKAQICGWADISGTHGCTEQPSRTLALQVNFLQDTPAVGEFDIDFDAGQLSRSPHMRPSNSDPLAVGREGRHLDMLNYHFRFSPALAFDCHDRYNHGREAYDHEQNCIR